MLKDVPDFIYRGNGIDLAISVIMGAAFTAIINSMVGDMFMPLIGALLGGVHLEGLAIQVSDASINYGKFIQAVINFVLIALVIFFTLRAIVAVGKELGVAKEEEQEPEPEPEPPEDIKLLTEIRHLLKENSATGRVD